jgi:hypothetical protein
VDIDGNGFWMRDSILELWLRLAALHLEDQVDDHSPVHTIRNQWLLASRGFFTGCVPLKLGANVATREGRTAVVDATHSLLNALRRGPARLDHDVLNLLGIDGFERDINAAQLIEVGEALLDLINGKRFGGPSDTEFMPGSGS